MHEVTQHLLAASKDDLSVYSAIKKSYKDDHEKLRSDLLALLFGGHDTSSHTLTAMMFYFLKHSDERKALLEELTQAAPDGKVELLTLS